MFSGFEGTSNVIFYVALGAGTFYIGRLYERTSNFLSQTHKINNIFLNRDIKSRSKLIEAEEKLFEFLKDNSDKSKPDFDAEGERRKTAFFEAQQNLFNFLDKNNKTIKNSEGDAKTD